MVHFYRALLQEQSSGPLPRKALYHSHQTVEHDNWKNIQKISNSVEDFSKIISLINKTNINDVDKCNKLKDDIQKIITCDFWDIQIDSAKD